MSNIPTNGDHANNKATAAHPSAASQDNADVKFYTDQIIKAMNAGRSFYKDPTQNVELAVLIRLHFEFGKAGWFISVSNDLTGCTICWS